MTISTSPTPVDDRQAASISARLKLYFAALSCLGGLVLSSGSETESIPVIAVFFSIFGYVFVDYLKLFALPPIAAYAAMAVAAFYCVSDFADLDEPGNHQMVAVAQLLVFVQAILMLQKKSKRIFEQLGVFCLLELIVAAVFNNAISYGLLLIPIAVIGSWALSLLAAVAATEGLGVLRDLQGDDDGMGVLRSSKIANPISVAAPESIRSLTTSALQLPGIALVALAPAVLMVGAIFFYGLPRTTDAARVRNRGQALVGFSDELRLEQIGEMLQSTQPAMRVYLSRRGTGQDYQVAGSLYLRGRVLERYKSHLTGTKNSASWNSAPKSLLRMTDTLPSEFFPARSTDENFFDQVAVSVVCESMRSNSLFMVAPYHRIKDESDVQHSFDRWTVERRSDTDWIYPRISYTFGTNAFRGGVQTDLVARTVYDPSAGSSVLQDEASSLDARRDRAFAQRDADLYVDELLDYDLDAIPTAKALADNFVKAPSGERRTDYEIVQAINRYLAGSPDFQYTLNLNFESVPGLDPIEQFLSVDRKGHCQYFASALVMMLRSQGIPARVVVGYHTDEYNELGRYYVARQLHAHSWVEALIDQDQLLFNQNVYGQPPAERYWLRLDPTPMGGRVRDSIGGVGQYFDVAQNMWDDYVVDMDSQRQDTALFGGGMNPMNRSYEKFVDWMSLTIGRIQAGELGGGSLASRDLFSWPAAVFGVGVTISLVLLLRFRPPTWLSQRMRRKTGQLAATPEIPFYAQTLQQLARVGIHRQPSQTPNELRDVAAEKLKHPTNPSIAQPLAFLTSVFYRTRFGRPSGTEPLAENHETTSLPNSQLDEALAELTRSLDSVVAGKHADNKKKAERST